MKFKYLEYLTVYFTTTKIIYCTFCNGTQSGGSGNDLSSAFKKLLDAVASQNKCKNLVTWSDSSVPQNCKSYISNAVLNFMRENQGISTSNHGRIAR